MRRRSVYIVLALGAAAVVVAIAVAVVTGALLATRGDGDGGGSSSAGGQPPGKPTWSNTADSAPLGWVGYWEFETGFPVPSIDNAGGDLTPTNVSRVALVVGCTQPGPTSYVQFTGVVAMTTPILPGHGYLDTSGIQGLTVGFWFKGGGVSTNLALLTAQDHTNTGWRIYSDGSGGLFFEVYQEGSNGGSTRRFVTLASIVRETLGEWVHIAVRFDNNPTGGTGLRLSVNCGLTTAQTGGSIGSAAMRLSTANHNLRVGQSTLSSVSQKTCSGCAFGEIRIYTKTLTDSEMDLLCPTPVTATGEVARYTFSDVGSDVPDESGYSGLLHTLEVYGSLSSIALSPANSFGPPFYVTFDGSSYLSFEPPNTNAHQSTPELIQSPLTLSFWINRGAARTGREVVVSALAEDTNDDEYGYEVAIDSATGELTMHLCGLGTSPGNCEDVTLVSSLAASTWTHVTIMVGLADVTDADIDVWINCELQPGSLVFGNAPIAASPDGGGFMLGRSTYTTSESFRGSLGFFRVWYGTCDITKDLMVQCWSGHEIARYDFPSLVDQSLSPLYPGFDLSQAGASVFTQFGGNECYAGTTSTNIYFANGAPTEVGGPDFNQQVSMLSEFSFAMWLRWAEQSGTNDDMWKSVLGNRHEDYDLMAWEAGHVCGWNLYISTDEATMSNGKAWPSPEYNSHYYSFWWRPESDPIRRNSTTHRWRQLWFGQAEKGAWHHVAVTYNANEGQVRGYVDGVLTGSAYTTTGICQNTQTPFNIGRSQIGAQEGEYPGAASFGGEVADVVFLDVALTADELQHYYERCL